VSQIYIKGMCCHQISNGNVCILIIVHCHVVSLLGIVTQFVNFDARLLPVLGKYCLQITLSLNLKITSTAKCSEAL
jgi:hypothetical protein